MFETDWDGGAGAMQRYEKAEREFLKEKAKNLKDAEAELSSLKDELMFVTFELHDRRKEIAKLKDSNREMVKVLASIYTLYLRWEYAPIYEGIIDKTDTEVVSAIGKMAREAVKNNA